MFGAFAKTNMIEGKTEDDFILRKPIVMSPSAVISKDSGLSRDANIKLIKM